MRYWGERDQEYTERAPHGAYRRELCWAGRLQLPSTLVSLLCAPPSCFVGLQWILPTPPLPLSWMLHWPHPSACFYAGPTHIILTIPTWSASTCLSEGICSHPPGSPCCSLTALQSVPLALGLVHTWAFAFARPFAWNILPHVFHNLALPSSLNLDVISSRKLFLNLIKTESPPCYPPSVHLVRFLRSIHTIHNEMFMCFLPSLGCQLMKE